MRLGVRCGLTVSLNAGQRREAGRKIWVSVSLNAGQRRKAGLAAVYRQEGQGMVSYNLWDTVSV